VADEGEVQQPAVVVDDGGVRVTAVAVTHGHAVPALAYRFDTADGSVVFSGDTTVNEDLIALAHEADILVHCVADLGYLERHGITGAELERMAGLHTDVTEVGTVAERAGVNELVLTHYLPAEPGAIGEAEWVARAGTAFSGRTTAGRDGLRRVIGRVGH
jgi:ribonuclease BN (tRNA processing enzyme)